MMLGTYEIQPIMLYLDNDEKWLNRTADGITHFESVGITDILKVKGIHGESFGIEGTLEYNHDNPHLHHKIGTPNTSLCLSMQIVYQIELHHKADYFLFLEDDSRFKENWREVVERSLNEIPKDFDFLFIGSCCAEGKDRERVGTHLYKYSNPHKKYAEYPLCGNAYIVAKKAIPKILETQKSAYVNVDINLAVNTFNHLNVYAILPRVVEQNNNEDLPQ